MKEKVLNVKYDRSKKYFDIIKFSRHKHVSEDVNVISSISDTVATRVDQPKANCMWNCTRNFEETRIFGEFHNTDFSRRLSSQIGFLTVSLPLRPSNNGSRAARTECTVISNNDRLNCYAYRGGATWISPSLNNPELSISDYGFSECPSVKVANDIISVESLCPAWQANRLIVERGVV